MAVEMNDNFMDGSVTEDLDALSELDNLFSEEDDRLKKAEENVLSQNLSGFASCFPDWDLHPPVE